MVVPSLPDPEYHWVFPHHFAKFDATTTLRVLDIFERYEGEPVNSNRSPARNQINRDIRLLLSEDERAGVPDPFRDYQQLYYHIGMLYPHKIANGELHLTPIAKQLTGKRIGLSEFLFLQAFGYQYPNGASEPSVTQKYIQWNILVKPILLIYQVLAALQLYGAQQAYISQDEIITFLEPQRDHSTIEEIVRSILEVRRPQFGHTIPLPYHYPTDTQKLFNERIRAVAEFVRFLEFLPFFEVFPDAFKTRKYRLRFLIPENEQIGLPEVQALAAIEMKPETFYQFSDGELSDRLKWYEYYAGLERRSRWYHQARRLASLQAQPPALNLKQLAASQPPTLITVAPAVVQRTPEQTAAVKQQRLDAHQQVFHELASRVFKIKGSVRYDTHSVDLDALIDLTRYFFEIKSLAEDQSDSVEQLREAIGQLLEYQYRAGKNAPDGRHLCVVFDRFPDAESWVVQYLTNHLLMGVCWWNSDTQRFEFPDECLSELEFLADD